MRIPWGKVALVLIPIAALTGAIAALVVTNFPPLVHYSQPSRAAPSTTAAQTATAHRSTTTTSEKSEGKQNQPWLIALVGMLVWPVTLVSLVLLLIFSRTLRQLFGVSSKIIRKISAGGIEMEISSDAVDQVRDHLKSSFQDLVADARDQYDRMADLQDIESRISIIINNEIRGHFAGSKFPSDLRATVHVRDIVFKEFLYQLVDYVPKGGGSHRRFSQRYGIIGRSWRSAKSQGTGNAFHGLSSEDALVEQWGMTREEAHGMLNSKHSCLSVLLRSGGIPVGILYIDTDQKDAFGEGGDANTFAARLEVSVNVKDLADAVERTMAPLRAAAPNLDLKDLG